VVVVRIELDSLEGSSGAFTHAYESGELDFNDDRVRLGEPPRISGRVTRKGNRLLLEGRLFAQAVVDCDRCLKELVVPVQAEFSLQYVTPAEYAFLQAAELEEDDLALSVFDGEGIDIDEIVREQVLLAVPTRLLCADDCKGFCPVCGTNRNLNECNCPAGDADPRWAGLKRLVNRK
jgi:uncharacterized protein